MEEDSAVFAIEKGCALLEKTRKPFWSVHTHSRYSVKDAMPKVSDMVLRAAELGYPALGVTDHGTMAGVAQHYKAATKAGIKALPGIEMYVTPLAESRERKSMHLTMAAYTTVGYRNLVALNNYAHRSGYYFRPRVDFANFAQAADEAMTQGIAIGTGCRSGPVVRALVERGPAAAKQVTAALAGWFPRVYVEVMDHQFTAEGMWDHEITAALYDIAQELGLPMVLTSDSHYLVPEDKPDHDALKQLIAWTPVMEEAGFSGKGYWLPTWQDMAHIPSKVLDACEQGLYDLSDAAKVTIPELDSFSLKIPDVTLKGEQDLALADRFHRDVLIMTQSMKPKTGQLYRDRVVAELEVIRSTGMAGYLLLILLICDFMEREGIWFHVRGSAAGSLGLYVTGVTQYDPIIWEIRMDRFLSGDRTSAPDVDIDIEHERRNEVVAMLEKLGYEIRQVGTQPEYSLGFKQDNDEEEKGSLRVAYFSTMNRSGKPVGTWSDAPQAHKAALARLAQRGLISGVGAHPGGYIIAKDAPTADCLPMVRIDSSGTMVTAFDKGEIEEFGFPKVDLLGSKALTAIKVACELIVGASDHS